MLSHKAYMRNADMITPEAVFTPYSTEFKLTNTQVLILSETTTFRHFQIERVCRRQF